MPFDFDVYSVLHRQQRIDDNLEDGFEFEVAITTSQQTQLWLLDF